MFQSAVVHSVTACTGVSTLRGFGSASVGSSPSPASTIRRENRCGSRNTNANVACSSSYIATRCSGVRRRHSVVALSSAAEEGSTLSESRSSPGKVSVEMRACYDLVERMGRGAVYLGSARVPEDHPHFKAAEELARDVAATFDCTTWSGLGAGMMEAVTRGGKAANKPVAGFMILLEAGGVRQASRTHPYLPDDVYHTTSFFSARKHGLVDAGVRVEPSDRTAFFALPGGVGTLDEIFEVLALLQLKRMGTAHPVPFIVMNYDGCFDGLLQFLERDMVRYGSLSDGELKPHWKVCETNEEALSYLQEFYDADGR